MTVRLPDPHQAGSSPVSAVFGLTMFLAVLLLVSQVLLHLFATSVVTSVAFDTASQVAAEGRDCGPDGATAEAIARARLGTHGDATTVAVRCTDGAATVVTVRTRSPARALSTVTFGLGLRDIERTAVVRTEQVVR